MTEDRTFKPGGVAETSGGTLKLTRSLRVKILDPPCPRCKQWCCWCEELGLLNDGEKPSRGATGPGDYAAQAAVDNKGSSSNG